jgi:pSer/pThr/pTyr-binding forkhead associated (FHA) protein
MINVVLLLLKWFFLALLYIFLIIALFIIYRDLRATRKAPTESEGTIEAYSKLVVLESPGEKKGETFFINSEATLGRTSGCDIIISDVSVSHKHARISKSTRGFALEDLGSTNGTFLNNRKISRPALIKPGDLIKVGKTTFEFME